ncbi:hypothetical protein PPL_08419 [Heterostelium album PN500]|uniref:Uncharacterized protein n=1 Tax=Heterostelium pallidum (strain ATCC 26659 / Pp 5 / PN500) TaxID=670386 RepID=D3BI51_HETP5|nr:hypothetical protein PPL_08419 [Heterostelium album PN500]EFA78951.1 hypothetical protein PPL_08419 [Heterostelium album PN500]|eukprot:XP_020431075.1 hypothetical protein PPL_08419 [Heterostelium album PN500]
MAIGSEITKENVESFKKRFNSLVELGMDFDFNVLQSTEIDQLRGKLAKHNLVFKVPQGLNDPPTKRSVISATQRYGTNLIQQALNILEYVKLSNSLLLKCKEELKVALMPSVELSGLCSEILSLFAWTLKTCSQEDN